MPPTHALVVRRALDTGGQHATTAPFSLLHTYFAGVHTNLLRHEHRPEWQGTRHKMRSRRRDTVVRAKDRLKDVCKCAALPHIAHRSHTDNSRRLRVVFIWLVELSCDTSAHAHAQPSFVQRT
jgi:hypothetical protein